MPLITSAQRRNQLLKAALFFPALTLSLLTLSGLVAIWLNRDIFLPGRDLAEIRKSGKLQVLLSYDPINYFIYKGTPMGYSYELAQRFADELGVRLEVVPVRNLNHQIPMLRNGEGDLIAHPMTVIESRTDDVSFSTPLDSTRQVLIQRTRDSSATGHRMVRTLEELDRKTVYVREKSAYFNNLMEIRKRSDIALNIVPVHGSLTTGELISRVNSGKIDFTVADSNIAVPHKALYPALDISTVISRRQPLAWAVRKNAPQLRSALDHWLAAEQRTGYLQMLRNKYYNQQYRVAKHAFSAFYSEDSGSISSYDNLVKTGAGTIGWDWRLLSSLIYEESQFDPKVVSWAGAVGLMQVMPSTAAISKISRLSDPELNIRAGTAYLGTLEKEWREIGDPATRIKFILASYNAGPGHVRDAQKLALKYGANPALWEDNVERYLTLKSEPRYYNDAVAELGYCNGAIPVRYTRNILSRYQLYMQVIPK
ncbi:MAG: transporter substrate-binding domain-containing protein [Chlorobiaceae bacterium]|nr:transporter substrate-binding domain-containing protein [Chlorobiaceae bacterium]